MLFFCLTFQKRSTLKAKQILSFTSRSFVKELHHSVKQTGIHASQYNIIFGEDRSGSVCVCVGGGGVIIGGWGGWGATGIHAG